MIKNIVEVVGGTFLLMAGLLAFVGFLYVLVMGMGRFYLIFFFIVLIFGEKHDKPIMAVAVFFFAIGLVRLIGGM